MRTVNKLMLVLGLVATPSAAAKPDPNCFPVYREYHVGPVVVIQRSTCQYEVGYDEDWGPDDELP